MRTGATRITRKQFYTLGGFSNTSLFRKLRGHAWHYYQTVKP